VSTLVDLLRTRAREHPERTATLFLLDGETEADRRTYAALDTRARAIAARLQERGAVPGDRALLLYPPGLDFIDAFFGCLYAGVVAVPCYPPRPGREQPRLKAILADAGARFALSTAAIAGKLESLAEADPEIETLARIATETLPSGLEDAWRPPALDGSTLAFLQYTSGSTATPKGVMVTHANLVFMERLIQNVFEQDETSVVVGWLPVYHDMGLIGNVLQPLWLGATCVLMAPVAFLRRPRRWLEAISRYRATTSGGPSFAYELCVERIAPEERQGLDLSTWRVAFNGAEPVRAAVLDRFAAAFAPAGFRRSAFQPCYGLAEATLLVSGLRASGGPVLLEADAVALEEGKIAAPDGTARRRTLVGCGAVPAEQPVAVVDPATHQPCPPGRIGELWVQGPGVAAGYWQKPDETRETFGAMIDETGPWLRTGDLGFLHEGELYVTGRLKDLIILRGRNHYPQDLERTAERSAPGLAIGANAAFSVEQDGEERLVVVQELAPRARLDEVGMAAAASAIRRAVAEEHEVQVWEVLLVPAGTVPKTSSGKIQRRATRSLYLDGALEPLEASRLAPEPTAASTAPDPQDPEPWLRLHAAAVLRVAPGDLDPDRPLLDYGLDSLAAIELGQAIENAFGVILGPGDFLEGASTRALARRVRETSPPWPPSPIAPPSTGRGGNAVSSGERGLWLEHRRDPKSTAYHLAAAARLHGNVSAAALRAAFQALVDRHPALRTTFHDEDGEPIRHVHPHAEVSFEEIEGVSLDDLAWRPFNLQTGPLLRVSLIHKGPNETILLLVVHHIVADFWSFGILAKQLAVAAFPPSPGAGEGGAGRGAGGEGLWPAWRARLEGLPPLDLPTDRPRPALLSDHGSARRIEIHAEILDDLRALAHARGTTLYTVLLAGFQALLHRYTGQADFAVGSPTARRPGAADAVGYFVSPVVLRADLSGDPSFTDLVDRTRRRVLDALELQDLPLPLLVEKLRAEGQETDLFRALFVLHRAPAGLEDLVSLALGEPGGRLRLGAFELEPLPLTPRGAAFDITLAVGERRGALGAALVFRTDLLDGTTAARWLEHWATLLAGAAAHPEHPVGALLLLPAWESHQVLFESNDETTADPAWTLLHEGFERQAERTPDAVALIDGSRRLTYRELNEEADRLANHLRSRGAGPETVVGVHLPRTAKMVTALLAVLKSGAAYLPLDTTYPEERIKFLVEDAGAFLLLAAPEGQGHVAQGFNPGLKPTPDGLAYLIYTSGSTGRPKGVAITHASAVRLVAWAGEAYAREELARVLAATSINFDLSVFEIFVPLSFGGAVVLAENALSLPSLLPRDDVTLINTVPSALATLLDLGPLPASVRTVNLAGEPLRRPLAERVLAAGVRLWDLYGPSEDTTYSTGALVRAGDPGEPSIGRPVAGSRAYVLDAALRPAPLGIPGELCLGGGGLARGYLGRPDLTAERFVPDPFSGKPGERLYRTGDLARRTPDGALDYLGRLDHQVKIRGFRIEPGEIEAALLVLPSMREAVVVPRDGALVAYVSPRLPEEDLREHLRQKLPAPFIPSAFVFLDALPLTPNGKVDRKALPAPEGPVAREFEAPSGPLEETLAALFAEALGLPRIGARDDFFALGGHSLLAARVLSRVSGRLGVDLPLSTLFRSPTVRDLAGVIAEGPHPRPLSHLPPLPPPGEGRQAEARVLSFAQERLWLLDRLHPGEATYNMPGALVVEGPLDIAALTAAFKRVVRRHEILRTRFEERDGQPVQIVDPGFCSPLSRRGSGREMGEGPGVRAPLLVDLSALPEPLREQESSTLAAAEAARPFDLTRGPLLRVTLLRLAPERHWELVTLHHIAADGWSLGILAREIEALYNGASLPDPPMQYADFAAWQRQQLANGVLETQLAWWMERLAGAPTVLELPTDRRPAVRTARGARVESHLSADLADSLRDLGRRQGATFFQILLAGFQALLLRITGQDDFLVGTVTANRTRPETENLIGLFADTLVLRAELAGDPAFTEALARARETVLGAFAHQDLPFERLVAALQPDRALGQTPLLQAVLVFQGARGIPAALPLHSGTAKFDLTLEIEERAPGLTASWELSLDLFDPAAIQRMAGWFATLLAGASSNPGASLSDLPLLNAEERRQLLAFERAEPSRAPLEVPVHRLFEEQARQAPERTALVANGNREISYSALDARANRLARQLLSLGVRPETRVGVALERSPEMIEAFLAVLKAGGAYVPLDPSYPPERIATMTEEAGVELILTAESFAAEAIAAQSPDPLPTPDIGRLAYVLFTSGSTGRPKAVAVEHRAIVRLVRDAGFADLGPDQTFLQLAPPAFDASTLEIWAALANGGRLVLAPAGPLSLDDLGEILARHQVSILWLTAGLFHEVVESRISILRGLRQLLAGGDVLSPAAVNRVLAELPGCRMINGYGPTENTTFTCCHTVLAPIPEGATVPLGRPIRGTRVHVLDRWLQPVPTGVPGELCAGGDGLARGYLGRPDLTAERFVPDPFAAETGQPGARVYQTGDRVRWRPDGTLEFLGRIDRQVKIRGFRVEPGEVEAVLAHHPAVAQAAVLVLGEGAAGRHLAAFMVPTAGVLSLDDLRAWLAGRLPAYLVPDLVFIPELPLNPNGKVDRAALARLAPGPQHVKIFNAPRTPTEELIAGIWADVLEVEQVGIDDDFFALGGHSLLATRVVSRIVDALGIDLPLSALFEFPTVAGLAAAVEGTARKAPSPLTPLPSPAHPVPGRGENLGRQPLSEPFCQSSPLSRRGAGWEMGEGPGVRSPSFAQQRLWFLDRLEPGSPAYNLPVAVRLRGPLDRPALAAALGAIVQRHEALRTAFPETPDGPVQAIAPPLDFFELPVVDLAALDTAAESEASRRMGEEARRPFDLQRGPVLRCQLLRLDADHHLLVVNLHHIAGDGWSMGLLVRELGALYAAFHAGRPSPLRPLPIQYADYAEWQRRLLTGEVLAAEVDWWREALAGLPEKLDLPTDRPRRALERRPGAWRPVRLEEKLTRDLGTLARREGVTLFMVILAAFQALLGRHAGQDDLAVGSPIAGRSRVELEGLIGFFVNTLVLRADLSGEPDVRELLRRTRARVLAAYRHQHLPFEKLVEELAPARDLGSTPFFSAMLAFQGPAPEAPVLPGLIAEIVPLQTGTARLDLLLDLSERGGALTGFLEYSRDLFDAATADRLLGHLTALLAAAVADPGRRLAELPILSTPEQHQLLEWNATATAWPEATLPALFAAQAAATPDRLAVTFAGSSLTYRELDESANRLARHLRRRSVGPETVVGVALERSLDLIIALYAVHKAGGAYLPLDLSHPAERIKFLVEDTGALLVLTRESLDADREAIAAESSDPLPLTITPANLAYVIFTSGSTGAPKGAMNTHAGIANRLLWMQDAYRLGAVDRVLQKTPATFDVSVWEFFWPLLTGARLVVTRPDEHKDPASMLRTLRDEEVTTLHFVPSMLQVFLDEPGVEKAASVRQVMASGEALPADLARRFFERLPGAQLHNLYGPTEAAVDVTAWTCEPEDASVPIGRPIANIDIQILNRAFGPVPIGAPGELCIGGIGLARGYRNRPALTAERFIPHPEDRGERLYRTGDLARWRPDGRIEYLGRLDHQVKIRGQRIEPGEIEAALNLHPHVRESLVLAREDRPGDRRLVAYLVARGSAPEGQKHVAREREPRDQSPEAPETGPIALDVPALRRFLRERLPEALVPAAFVVLPAFPLNANGKLDRKALPAPGAAPSAARTEPRTAAEQTVAAAWREVLGVERIGVDESFFDLGGHSLLATRVASRLRDAFGLEVPVRALFETPTVTGLAASIESRLRAERGGEPEPPLVPVADRPVPLSFAQQRLWFLAQLDPASAVYNIPAQVDLRGPLDVPALDGALREITRRHESLRTVFQVVGTEPAQIVLPAGDFALPLIDLSNLGEQAADEAQKLTADSAVRPFDLQNGPVFRASLLRLADDEEAEHRLLVAMHHSVSDGWSLGIFLRELSSFYRLLFSPLPGIGRGELGEGPGVRAALPIQYSDFAVWQRRRLTGETLERELAFWRWELRGLPAGLDLPADHPRPPVQTVRGASRLFSLEAATAAGLRRLARTEEATLFMVLMTGFQMLLARLAGQDDFAVGTPVAGRTRTELEGLIGFFVNTLVLRADFGDDPAVRTALGRTRERSLAAQAHQDLPFERLVEELKPERNLSRPPLVQVLFVFQNTPREPLDLPGLAAQPKALETGTAKFELHLSLDEDGDAIHGTMDFNRDLFDPSTVDRLLGHFAALLAAFDPGRRLSELLDLQAPERRQIEAPREPAPRPQAPPVPPRTATEEAIAAAWREVLGLDSVGVEDSFFDLGGHSLLIVQVHRLLTDRFPALAVLDLFRYPTISALAAFLTQEKTDQVSLEESRERAETRTDRVRQQRELRRQVRKR
jgi:amino acid adenylation domain-containing protein